MISQPELFGTFALAEHLGKTAAEIEQITVEEWHHWLAYFKIKQERERCRHRK